MKDCKFKQLILDVYKEWEKPERTFKKKDIFGTIIYKNFWGTLFGAITRHSFDEITNIEEYMSICNPNMFMLNSRVSNQELEIYDYQLQGYKIDGNKLILQLENGEVIFEM